MAANNQNQSPASIPGVSKIDPLTLPGFIPAEKAEVDLKKCSVRYLKADLDSAEGRTDLEHLETRAIRGDGVYILNKDKFTFMDKYFMIVAYMEENA